MFNLEDKIDDEQLRLSAECSRLRKELDEASEKLWLYLRETSLTDNGWKYGGPEQTENHWCEDCH